MMFKKTTIIGIQQHWHIHVKSVDKNRRGG